MSNLADDEMHGRNDVQSKTMKCPLCTSGYAVERWYCGACREGFSTDDQLEHPERSRPDVQPAKPDPYLGSKIGCDCNAVGNDDHWYSCPLSRRGERATIEQCPGCGKIEGTGHTFACSFYRDSAKGKTTPLTSPNEYQPDGTALTNPDGSSPNASRDETARREGESAKAWEKRLVVQQGTYHTGYSHKCLACGSVRYAAMRMHYYSADRANSRQHTDECPIRAALKTEEAGQ